MSSWYKKPTEEENSEAQAIFVLVALMFIGAGCLLVWGLGVAFLVLGVILFGMVILESICTWFKGLFE